VDGNAAANADPSGGGKLDELQDQIPGEVFFGLSETCSRGRVAHITTGKSTCAGIYLPLRVFSEILLAGDHRGVVLP